MLKNRYLPPLLLLAAGLCFLSACSSTPTRLPPGQQDGMIVIAVPGVASVTSQKMSYDCDGLPVSVEYINAGETSLATLKFKEEFVIASQVISASGARYAGKHYVWWSKGDEASFQNLMQDPETPSLQCRALS